MMPRRSLVTTRTHQAFARAHTLAADLGHDEVTPAHIMLGILRHHANPAAQILLYSVRIDRQTLERELEALLPPPGASALPGAPLQWTAADEAILEQAAVESRELGTDYLATEHVLLSFLRNPSSPVSRLLDRHGVRLETVRDNVRRLNDGTMTWAAADQNKGMSAP